MFGGRVILASLKPRKVSPNMSEEFPMSRKLIALLVAGALVTGALQPVAATVMQTKAPPAFLR